MKKKHVVQYTCASIREARETLKNKSHVVSDGIQQLDKVGTEMDIPIASF